MVYYLPVWFQGVQGVSAVQSGIRNLPLILALVLMSIISGIGVSVLGYCMFTLLGYWSFDVNARLTENCRRTLDDRGYGCYVNWLWVDHNIQN
jgi:hypothetical protein